MDKFEILLGLISAILGSTTVLGWIFYGKANRRIKRAEARHSEWQIEAERLRELRETNHTLNGTIAENSQRIAELNKALDDKTDRIRKISDDLFAAQNQRIAAAEEIAKLRALLTFYQQWHCRREQTDTPDGCLRREPPQKIALRYTSPENL